jgi:hypothetical protein
MHNEQRTDRSPGAVSTPNITEVYNHFHARLATGARIERDS